MIGFQMECGLALTTGKWICSLPLELHWAEPVKVYALSASPQWGGELC
jgi:hypothetical protein